MQNTQVFVDTVAALDMRSWITQKKLEDLMSEKPYMSNEYYFEAYKTATKIDEKESTKEPVKEEEYKGFDMVFGGDFKKGN